MYLQPKRPLPLSVAQEKVLAAESTAPTLTDFDNLFRAALGETMTGKRSVTGELGDQFVIAADRTSRFITWQRPVAFPAVLIDTVTPQMRKNFLEGLAGYVFQPSMTISVHKLLTIGAVASEGKTLKKGFDTDVISYFKSLTFRNSGGSAEVSVAHHGKGYKITSSVDLQTGDNRETHYFVTSKGKPVNPHVHHQTETTSPIDVLIPGTTTKTDRMIWSNYKPWSHHSGPWQENTQVDFSLGGNPHDLADMGSGFRDSVERLMKVLNVKKEAVVKAECEDEWGILADLDWSQVSMPSREILQ